MTTKKEQLIQAINEKNFRSCWDRGVKAEALDMVNALQDSDIEKLFGSDYREARALLLNGADNWTAYSYGGCALIYDQDICERYATPSEIKRTHCGEKKPNARESWLDVQARGCAQALDLVRRAVKHIESK